MANLTITVDPETLKRARIKAIREGTSVNRVLGTYLESFAGEGQDGYRESDGETPPQTAAREAASGVTPEANDEAKLLARGEAIDRLFDAARPTTFGDTSEGRGWTREEIYDRPIMLRDR